MQVSTVQPLTKKWKIADLLIPSQGQVEQERKQVAQERRKIAATTDRRILRKTQRVTSGKIHTAVGKASMVVSSTTQWDHMKHSSARKLCKGRS